MQTSSPVLDRPQTATYLQSDLATPRDPSRVPRSEERLILIVGFVVGFAIGGIFLAYVVLSAARLL